MGIKKFRPALEDCQQAAALQSASPSPKTLIRLARCQLAIGSPTPALSTLRSALSIDPKNAAALQLQEKVLELEAHLRNFDGAKRKKQWGMARLALDKCLQGIEGEGGEIPTEWRLWRVELELTRGNFEAANIAAKSVGPVLWHGILTYSICLQRCHASGAQLARGTGTARPCALPDCQTASGTSTCIVGFETGPWTRTCAEITETGERCRTNEGRG